jgi:uncharacterized flavoprotein (TIGR03862 family)
MTSNGNIAVIGGGPAGLMAAEVLAEGGAVVTVYDRMPSVGRKFLLAGRGGLNLTHSESFEKFLERYGATAPMVRGALEAFSPAALRAWSESLGQTTFVGSSGRVFPTAMKASPLLRGCLARLRERGVTFRLRHRWRGWTDEGALSFDAPGGDISVTCDAAVLALGGASWPRLGSTGEWVAPLASAGVAVAPLRAANSGFAVRWSDLFRSRFAGHPLKRIALSSGGASVRGEAIVTDYGLEGGAIYALSAQLRETIAASGEALLHVDLRPDVSHDALVEACAAPRGKRSLATFLRKIARLSPVAIGLLHEAAIASSQAASTMSPAALADLIKAVPVRLTGVAPIARAISTAGGVSFDAIDGQFMLRSRPGVFVAGEMLDYDAPTGGYLLQAAFATGAAAGRGALAWLAATSQQAPPR